MQKCLALFKLDYNTIEIGNPSGELSSHYPNLIVIPENEKHAPNAFANIQQTATASNGSVTPPPPSLSPANGLQTNTLFTQRAQHQQATIYENSYDPRRLRDLMIKARLARSRTRFPVPVILYKGKFVCRSSTLSSGPELYTRSSIDYFFSSTTTDDVDHSRQGKYARRFICRFACTHTHVCSLIRDIFGFDNARCYLLSFFFQMKMALR